MEVKQVLHRRATVVNLLVYSERRHETIYGSVARGRSRGKSRGLSVLRCFGAHGAAAVSSISPRNVPSIHQLVDLD